MDQNVSERYEFSGSEFLIVELSTEVVAQSDDVESTARRPDTNIGAKTVLPCAVSE